MKRSIAVFLFLLAAGASLVCAQVEPSAYARRFTLTAGGFGTFFQPDLGPNRLFGLGTYVDIRFSRWIQPEGEARWLRFHQYANTHEDNYLAGLRLPIHRYWKATPYGKVLVGMGSLNYYNGLVTGHLTDIAYGGGVDIELNHRWTVRAFDFEYQQWPNWIGGGTLHPYGGSAGLSYRIF
jgi:hypothetical protein